MECATVEIAAIAARDVLHMRDAVALGTGSFRTRHVAERVQESYVEALTANREPEPDPWPEPTAAELEWLGWDLFEGRES